MTFTIDSPASLRTAPRNAGQAMLRGARHKCPRCAEGSLYTAYLKVADHCGHCGEALHHQRADDAPPYFTMFIVGHVALAGILALEQTMKPSASVHAAIWLPFVVIMSLVLLPRVKGVLIGLQWALRMHGFGEPDRTLDATPVATASQAPVGPPAMS